MKSRIIPEGEHTFRIDTVQCDAVQNITITMHTSENYSLVKHFDYWCDSDFDSFSDLCRAALNDTQLTEINEPQDLEGCYFKATVKYRTIQDDDGKKTILCLCDKEPATGFVSEDMYQPQFTNASRAFTLAELEKNTTEPPLEIVREILPEGVCIFAGESGSRKTFLALQLAESIASGKSFLGLETLKGYALYLALETPAAEIRRRCSAMHMASEDIINMGFVPAETFRNDSTSFCAESSLSPTIERIYKESQTSEPLRLVVIDIWGQVSGTTKYGENDHQAVYRYLNPLYRVANKHYCAIVLIHHTRKQSAFKRTDTPIFDEILGTSGLRGTSTSRWLLQKPDKQHDHSRLAIENKQAAPGQMNGKTTALVFDENKTRFERIGDEAEIAKRKCKNEYNANPIVTYIKDRLKESPTFKAKAIDIQQSLAPTNSKTPQYQSMSATSLGKNISAMVENLKVYDNIIAQRGGNGGSEWTFSAPHNESAML